MAKINADQICEVRILEHSRYPHYEYREAKKSIIYGSREAGFYNTLSVFGERFITVEEIEKDGQMRVIGKKVFWKPRVFIKMSNGDHRFMYFDTIEEAKICFDTHPRFKGIRWIDDVYE